MSSVSFSSTVSETLHAFCPQLQTLQPISKGFKNKKKLSGEFFCSFDSIMDLFCVRISFFSTFHSSNYIFLDIQLHSTHRHTSEHIIWAIQHSHWSNLDTSDIIISRYDHHVKFRNPSWRTPLILRRASLISASSFRLRPTIFQSPRLSPFPPNCGLNVAIWTLWTMALTRIDNKLLCYMRTTSRASRGSNNTDRERLFRRWTEHGQRLECKARHVRPR